MTQVPFAVVTRKALGAFTGLLLTVSTALVFSVGAATTARADVSPPVTTPATPATVSADALPTVQINGVVWAQVTVGNTVYATGSFTSARPAGSPSGTNETPRAYLLAYDLTTGNLITSFNHTLNAQGRSIAASPDGTKLYVGGNFTQVDGVNHYRIAEFNLAAGGALVTGFTPTPNSVVQALTATNTTVYAGGTFTAVGSATRTRLAAFSSAGALLSWAPTADDYPVAALVVTPDGSKVIVGGSFTTINGQASSGLGAVSATTGLIVPWAAVGVVRDGGAHSGITSLSTNGSQVFGTGYVYTSDGPTSGYLEGTFAADANSGAINVLEDCHGDTYGAFATGSVFYIVGHQHYCGNIGAFPETNPRSYKYSTAYTTSATGTVAHNAEGNYMDWYGQPAPTQLNWYPTLTPGSYTGQTQAGWSITGNGNYISLGGEFPTVNGVGQQGLVRFAVGSIAPNKVGPSYSTNLTPVAASTSAGTVKVSWVQTADPDNTALTYKLVRNGVTTKPVYTTTVNDNFYTEQGMSFTDTGLTPGSTANYRVYVYDPFGNFTSSLATSVTVSSYVPTAYANDVINQGATNYWRLGETSGTTGVDWVGTSNLTEQAGVTHGATGAVTGDSDGASTFDGSSTDGLASTTTPVLGPQTFSVETWFKTTSTSGGKLIGFGNSPTGNSSGYDRHVYMDNAGHLSFGVCGSSCPASLTTAGTYNDGQWHQAVGTLSSAGMMFYIDGHKVGSAAGVTNAQSYSGYWRLGGDNLGGWNANNSSNYFAGSLDEAAVFPTALTLAQIQQQYTDSGRSTGNAPTPTDSYGKAVYALSPDNYWRLDDKSGTTAVDTTTNQSNATYQGGYTLGATSPVSGSTGTAVTLDGSSGSVVAQQQISAPSVYSEDAWFNTTTTSGGKIMGFGDGTTGESSNYDRHVIMLNTGQIEFGTYTGQLNLAISTKSYNDGAWHNVVATQGPDGMVLYIDGQAVATNAQTQAQGYNGYWHLGGDRTWGGASSDFFAGSIDEASFYNSTELSASQVLNQYKASPAATNVAPKASFTATASNLSVAFDGSSSADPDGTVASYSWNFGDGSAAASGVTPTHVYAAKGTYPVTLTVTDNAGGTGSTTQNVSVRAANAPAPTDSYGKAVYGLNPSLYWRLDETTGTTANDVSPNQANGTYQGGYTLGVSSPVSGSTGSAVTFDGSSGNLYSQDGVSNPQVFTESAWFRTTTTSGGKIVGFGNQQSGNSSNYDRQVFMTNSGQLEFGVNPGTPTTVTSPAAYNDGQWHQIVATLGSGGMVLYVDGQQVGSDPNTGAQPFDGYWRVGGDNENGWPNPSSSFAFGGTIDEVAVFPSQLTAAQAQSLYQASPLVTQANKPPVAAFTSTSTNLSVAFDGSASADPDGTVSSYSWNYGDGSAGGTGVNPTYAYAAAGTYTVVLTLTDNQGATNSVSHTVTVAAANQAPVAAFTSTSTNLSVAFDASGSSDPDGTVSSYSWNYGDGSAAGTGVNPTYGYAAAGTYTVTLTVTDNQGATNSVSHTVTVAAANQAPVASFTSSATNLSVALDGSASSDPDGTVASYSWNYGDGSAAGTGVKPTYAYAAAGTYTVTLTVTDNQGATNSVSHTVTVAAANQAPVAAFTSTSTNLSVAFDASGSSDPDGTVASYSWNYGDGSAAGTGVKPTYAYAAAGTYTVVLTVTDNQGATNAVSHTVTVAAAPANKPPVASFTSSATNLTISADGTGSSDPDGTVASYSWALGDGSATQTTPTVSHAYSTAGDYTVVLTVTDNSGASSSVSHVVTVRPAANAPAATLASDAFNRTVTGGLGTADTGGAWKIVGSAANTSVSGGNAVLAMPATTTQTGGYLPGVSSTDSDTTVTYTTDKAGTGGGISLYLVGRRVATNNEYRGRIRISGSTVYEALSELNNSSSETVIKAETAVPGVTYTPGTMLNARLQVTGTTPTTIRLKVWASTGTEPAAWQLTTTDSAASLQAAGAVGLTTYLSGTATNAPIVTKAANFTSRTTAAPPVAVFTASCTGRTCSVDGSGSTDPNNDIAGYAWNWADGTTTSGVTSSHTFTASGTYRITLTVTDKTGRTSVTTQTVTVS